MITITSEAARQILRSARQAEVKELHLRLAARLDAKGTIEYGMGFDDRAPDDLLAVSQGINLLISPGSVELLTGATLDFVEINPDESRFIFINPNDPSHKAPKPDGSRGEAHGSVPS